MKKVIVVVSAVLVSVLIGGCCKHKVAAAAFIGHLDPGQCRERVKQIQDGSTPVPMTCPGDEVTICYGANEVSDVKITVSPDPDGKSGTYPAIGALYLTPKADTQVTVATDCDSTEEKVVVITKPTPATFDASWDGECQKVSYTLDPLFVSPTAQTIDVTANWKIDCPTPPFLNGAHLNPLFVFPIDQPMTKTPFSSPQPAVGDWVYTLKAPCPDFRCDPKARLPFVMTLICPAR